MESTFITIHDLSRQARILYSSDSVVDILGHTPDEVISRSAWDFFHPDEVPFAREFHSRGVKLDKASVLAYCQLRNREGRWMGCECCFTIVYDVMVVCTSVYRRGVASQKRAVEAPIVRRLFSSSPKDPRYHMLTHLSNKFTQADRSERHEPRAALFLNRFTRTLTIMYATAGVEEILGIPGEEMKGRSFYYCIQQNCLEDAVRCLENAKGNDSIAYLRFWFRDPRQDDGPETSDSEDFSADEQMTEGTTESEADRDQSQSSTFRSEGGRSSLSRDQHQASSSQSHSTGSRSGYMSQDRSPNGTSSSQTSDRPPRRYVDGSGTTSLPSGSAASSSPGASGGPNRQMIEVESVISCASDGLVVCLRRARAPVPVVSQAPAPAYANGLYAAPWAQPSQGTTPFDLSSTTAYTAYAPATGYHSRRVEQPVPQPPMHQPRAMPPLSAAARDYVMDSIREVAVFAWALTGINGDLERFSHGRPRGEAQPSFGLQVYAPEQPGAVALQDGVEGNGAWRTSRKRPYNDGYTNGNHTDGYHSPHKITVHGPWSRANGYQDQRCNVRWRPHQD